ncbi:hypothetical protein [Mitsuaria sp. GD03876]|uniref:hypothetical protein n=1 Tax=Mitsuaria sp. GD03876 TaxID=2975399 RepID=UPI0024494F32|nr:hypothetical protein [Mitsuaria sp. GD03876]MDH0868221.1 hypothetical protein [Mitsuaria sp. GD03876]
MKSLIAVAALGFAALASPAQAQMVPLTSDPATWRVENYPGDVVAIWYAVPESECPGRQLVFTPNYTKTDLNRFWATYTAARSGAARMFLYYEVVQNPKQCLIRSFGIDNAR